MSPPTPEQEDSALAALTGTITERKPATDLDRILFEKKVSLTELAVRVDLTLANLSILKTNKARAIRFSTLEALCRELNCQPGDLLQYEGAQEDQLPPQAP